MVKTPEMSYAYYTDIGGRTRNEDAVRIKAPAENGVCLILADGLGGHGGGDKASAAAADYLESQWNGETKPDAVNAMIAEANRRVRALQTRLCPMKTTLAMLAVSKNTVLQAHAGDSRIYHFLNGELIEQSMDHSVAQMSVLLGDITPEEIRFQENRSRIFRALGQEEEPGAEISAGTLPKGCHAFLLCSDGFWEYVLEGEMTADLKAAANPADWIARMRIRLQARVKEKFPAAPQNDNNTAAVLWITIE